MEKELKELFKKYKLGRVCKIIKADYKWAHGDIYFVTTWLKKYIVYEKDGNSVKIGKDSRRAPFFIVKLTNLICKY